MTFSWKSVIKEFEIQSSVQDGIYALSKAHVHYTPPLSFPIVVFRIVSGTLCTGYLDHFAIEALIRTQIPGGVCVCVWGWGVWGVCPR